MNKRYIIYFLTYFCLFNIIVERSYSQTKKEIIEYRGEVFISYDYTFIGESLFKPSAIRVNPITNEIIILDEGNTCIYFFSNTGKFIKKIGRKGQGPGEFLGIKTMDIDKDGNIYVLDYRNSRMSIFDKIGHLKDTFRILGDEFTYLTITDDNTILINNANKLYMNLTESPSRTIDEIRKSIYYYIYEYTLDGNLLHSIGVVPNINKIKMVNMEYAIGKPFKIYNHYYIFLRYLGTTKIFNQNGEVVQNNEMKNIDIYNEYKRLSYYNPSSTDLKNTGLYLFFNDVIINNGLFYILTRSSIYDKYKFYLYILNNKLEIIKIIMFLSKIEIDKGRMTEIALLPNEKFIHINSYYPEVFLYSIKK
jgi:DNA-binding beta-propeller fold protein YncE